MEDLLFKIANPVFSFMFWLIIAPEARPWLYTTWAFSIALSIALLWTIFTDRSDD